MLAPALVGISLVAVWIYGCYLRLDAARAIASIVITTLCVVPAAHSVQRAAVYCAVAIALVLAQALLPEKLQPSAAVLLLGATAFVLLQGHREPLWSSPASLPMIGVFLAIVLAARTGVSRRRAYAAVVFVVALIAAMEDARLAPFFAMAAAPFAVEAGLP